MALELSNEGRKEHMLNRRRKLLPNPPPPSRPQIGFQQKLFALQRLVKSERLVGAERGSIHVARQGAVLIISIPQDKWCQPTSNSQHLAALGRCASGPDRTYQRTTRRLHWLHGLFALAED